MSARTNPKAELQRLGFTDSDIKMLEQRRATPHEILKVCRGLIEQGLTNERYARETFEELHPELFTAEWIPSDDKLDLFERFDFFNVPDLTVAERTPPEFLVDGILPVGLTFLSGAPKIRKSFLALQMAISIALGEPFLGKRTLQCDVVYFDLEGSRSRVSQRTQQMSLQIPRNILFTNRTQHKLADGLIDEICALHLQMPATRLFIIDTYSRARGNVKGNGANAYDADVQFLEPLQRAAIEGNIAILCVTHDKKGAGMVSDSFERLNGTMAISGSSDCVLNLIADGKRFEGRATLEVNPRDCKGCELNLEFDDFHLEWKENKTSKMDLWGNPVCAQLLGRIPDKQKEGIFIAYEDLFVQAYHCYSERPGDRIREALEPNLEELWKTHKLGVQMGVQSHGKRGIRVINLQ